MIITLSAGQKKLLHTGLVGFAAGVLAYLTSFVVGAPLPPARVIILAVLVAGISRAAGALLARIETQPPGPPA